MGKETKRHSHAWAVVCSAFFGWRVKQKKEEVETRYSGNNRQAEVEGVRQRASCWNLSHLTFFLSLEFSAKMDNKSKVTPQTSLFRLMAYSG